MTSGIHMHKHVCTPKQTDTNTHPTQRKQKDKDFDSSIFFISSGRVTEQPDIKIKMACPNNIHQPKSQINQQEIEP